MRSLVQQSLAALAAFVWLASVLVLPAPVRAAETVGQAITQNRTLIRLGIATVISGQVSGSGFFVGNEGHLLTSRQVTGDANTVTVRLATGGERLGKVMNSDEDLGVALIRIERAGGEALPIRIEPPRVGAPLFLVGSPFEETLMTSGRVEATGRESGQAYLRSDVEILDASTGGPVLDQFGNIVAIAKGRTWIGGSDLVPIMAALRALGLEGGKLAPPVTSAALRSPVPDAAAPKAPGGSDGERAAWDAIRKSRKRADYEAYLAAYPEGEFAALARQRAAVPARVVWSPVFAEPIPPSEKQRVHAFFTEHDRAAVRRLARYNDRNSIVTLGRNGRARPISKIEDVEVLYADQEGAVVKLIYLTGSLNWGVLATHIYKMKWETRELEPVAHQKP